VNDKSRAFVPSGRFDFRFFPGDPATICVTDAEPPGPTPSPWGFGGEERIEDSFDQRQGRFQCRCRRFFDKQLHSPLTHVAMVTTPPHICTRRSRLLARFHHNLVDLCLDSMGTGGNGDRRRSSSTCFVLGPAEDDVHRGLNAGVEIGFLQLSLIEPGQSRGDP